MSCLKSCLVKICLSHSHVQVVDQGRCQPRRRVRRLCPPRLLETGNPYQLTVINFILMKLAPYLHKGVLSNANNLIGKCRNRSISSEFWYYVSQFCVAWNPSRWDWPGSACGRQRAGSAPCTSWTTSPVRNSSSDGRNFKLFLINFFR